MLERTERNSIRLSEREKLQDQYLINEIDNSIASCLTMDKQKWMDAYNIRNGVRDSSDFAYLWEAYGIEFPSQLRHIPTLRSIFDSLVGQYIRRPFKYGITCTDEDSISYMMSQYREKILSDIVQYYNNRLDAAMAMQQAGDDSKALADHIAKIKEKLESGGYQSDLEILSSKMLRWSLQRFKLRSKLITMVNDWVTAGQAYYQVKVLQTGKAPLIRVVNPMNVFYTKGINTKFIKDCDRVVLKEKIPVTIAWSLYGHKMKESDRQRFIDNFGKYIIDSEIEILGYEFGTVSGHNEPELVKGLEIPMIDVNYVEWLSNTKVPLLEPEDSTVESANEDRIAKLKTRFKYRLDRYEGIRIGEDIYVEYGKSKYIVRDPDDPSHCSLTINGACFNDRNGEPYSLPLKTRDIADKIDILHYHAENLLAISGTKAIMVNFPDIPAWMGKNPVQRIMKWLGYLKQGLAVVDTSQEGAGVGKFNNMGDVDLSVSNAIMGIYTMIDNLEATAYKITGVPRQALGQITESDGKGTSQIALSSSEVVSELMFTEFDELAEQFLTDVVNACRIAYSKGIQGQLLLGEAGQKLFSIKNDKFKLAHLNVFVNGEGDVQRDLDDVKNVAFKLIEGQMIDPLTAIDMVTIKSLTELKQSIKNSVTSKSRQEKEELATQLQQVQGELENVSKELAKLQEADVEAKAQKVAIMQQDVDYKSQAKDRELNLRELFEQEKLKLDARRVELEALQLASDESKANEIRDN
jgi:anti-sigma28 factor (negative regulator of flagellin synthesis)